MTGKVAKALLTLILLLNYSNIVQTTALKRLKTAFHALFGGQRRISLPPSRLRRATSLVRGRLFESIENVVDEQASLGRIVFEAGEPAHCIGWTSPGGTGHIRLAGTARDGLFRESVNQ